MLRGDAFDYFKIECEIIPPLQMYYESKWAPFVSKHGPGTGWEVRLHCLKKFQHKKQEMISYEFEFVFTTEWDDERPPYHKKGYSHNELACVYTTSVEKIKNMLEISNKNKNCNDWLHIVAIYDKKNKKITLQVDSDTIISNDIIGHPCAYNDNVFLGQGSYYQGRKLFDAKIKNVSMSKKQKNSTKALFCN